MAATRRGYIFSAFLLSIVSLLLVIVSVSSDNWIYSTATAEAQTDDSIVNYGLFRGVFQLYILVTPTINTLYMTCLPDINSCALSCKTEQQAREDEVRALANGLRPNPACISVTTVDDGALLDEPAVISFAFHVCLLLVIFLQLVFSLISAILALINATRNPTEPIFGLPGCLWSNVITSILGVTLLLMYGIYFRTSGVKDHLAFSYIALGLFTPNAGLGYSYWLMIPAVLCSTTNIALIEVRRYLLERDPPPPTIKVENHSDGTIFLY